MPAAALEDRSLQVRIGLCVEKGAARAPGMTNCAERPDETAVATAQNPLESCGKPIVFGMLPLQVVLQRGGLRRFLPVLRGLLLALPVLVVFAGLLSSADLVFAGYLAALFHLDVLTHLPEMVWRTIVVLCAG